VRIPVKQISTIKILQIQFIFLSHRQFLHFREKKEKEILLVSSPAGQYLLPKLSLAHLPTATSEISNILSLPLSSRKVPKLPFKVFLSPQMGADLLSIASPIFVSQSVSYEVINYGIQKFFLFMIFHYYF